MMLFSQWVETQDPTEWDLDTATVQMLIDRFYFREICDDERMQRYWNRTLDVVRDRYRDILRIETIKFDPLVSKYFEGEYTVNGTKSGERVKVSNINSTNSKTGSKNEIYEDYTTDRTSGESDWSQDGTSHEGRETESTSDNLREDNRTGRDTRLTTGNSNNSSTTIGQTTDVNESSGTSSNISHEAIKQAPMNASGVQTIASGVDKGKLTGLDFDYASMYKQDDSTGATTNESTDTQNSNSTTTDSGTNTTNATGNTTSTGRESEDLHNVTEDSLDKTYHDEGGEHHIDQGQRDNNGLRNTGTSETGTGHTSGTDNITDTGSEYSVRHERYTGRDNVLPQDALKSAMNYLQNYSTAFEWLCNKLEINFIGIYDI